MADVREECGVAAILMKDDSNTEIVPRYLDIMLSAIQRRGQAGTGISVFKKRSGLYGKTIDVRKKPQDVSTFFGGKDKDKRARIQREYSGNAGIGHVRYTTSGNEEDDSLQPFYRRHGKKSKRFSFAFNGNCANTPELEARLRERDYDLETGTDTEIIMHLMSLDLKKQQIEHSYENFPPEFFKISQSIMSQVDGSYSLAMLLGNGDIGIMRDPQGFKPLVYGEKEKFYAIASESVALQQLGINNFKTVTPGNAMIFSRTNGVTEKQIVHPKPAHCHFEYIYFSDDKSNLEGLPIYRFRERIGKELALAEPDPISIRDNPDILICGAPVSALTVAKAYANFFGRSSEEAITKINKERTFINPAERRDELVERNFVINNEMIDGKVFYLIEDSVVRLTTLKKLISQIKEANPLEIHVRIADLPITHPCFYGINMSTHSELIANKYAPEKLEEEVTKVLGVNSFRYQRLDGLKSAFGEKLFSKLCLACLNGNYPTKFGKIRCDEDKEIYKNNLETRQQFVDYQI